MHPPGIETVGKLADHAALQERKPCIQQADGMAHRQVIGGSGLGHPHCPDAVDPGRHTRQPRLLQIDDAAMMARRKSPPQHRSQPPQIRRVKAFDDKGIALQVRLNGIAHRKPGHPPRCLCNHGAQVGERPKNAVVHHDDISTGKSFADMPQSNGIARKIKPANPLRIIASACSNCTSRSTAPVAITSSSLNPVARKASIENRCWGCAMPSGAYTK